MTRELHRLGIAAYASKQQTAYRGSQYCGRWYIQRCIDKEHRCSAEQAMTHAGAEEMHSPMLPKKHHNWPHSRMDARSMRGPRLTNGRISRPKRSRMPSAKRARRARFRRPGSHFIHRRFPADQGNKSTAAASQQRGRHRRGDKKCMREKKVIDLVGGGGGG